MVAPFIRQNIGEDQNKKKDFAAKRVGFQSKVCDDQKKRKKVFAYQSVDFRSQKKKTNKCCHPKMVTPGAGRPSDATDLVYVFL